VVSGRLGRQRRGHVRLRWPSPDTLHGPIRHLGNLRRLAAAPDVQQLGLADDGRVLDGGRT